jgi:hypothetical protein
MVRITAPIVCYRDKDKDTCWQESKEWDGQSYAVGMQTRDEACTKQFLYLLKTFSPVLQILDLAVWSFDGWWRGARPLDSRFEHPYPFRTVVPIPVAELLGLSEPSSLLAMRFSHVSGM